MNKPKFDPKQPYEGVTDEVAMSAAKPKFDPSKPYDDVQEPDSAAKLKQFGVDTLGALGKLAGVLRNTTTGPATAMILRKISGNPNVGGNINPLSNDSLNPTNLKQLPSNAEMFKQAGVPNPVLSDVIPSVYAKPGSDHPWWQPEKGGMLDPGVAGALQTATDPALWMAPELGPAEAVLAGHAAKNASLPMKALSMATSPVKATGRAVGTLSGAKAIGEGAQAIAEGLGKIPLVGPTAQLAMEASANPLGKLVVDPLGKFLYGSPLLPVTQQGEKFGKRGITDDLYAAGIKVPNGLLEEANKAAQALGAAKAQIIKGAGSVPGDIERATKYAQEQVNILREVRTQEAQELATHLQGKIDELVTQQRGIPGVPAIPPGPPTQKQVTKNLFTDSTGDAVPVTQTVTVPGTPGTPGIPAVPPQPFTAHDLDRLKTDSYLSSPNSSFKTGAPKSGHEEAFDKAMGRGMKEETMATVDKATGQGAALEDVNRAYGGLKSSQTGQHTASRQGDRNLHNVLAPTGIDALLAALGAHERGGGSLSILMNKLGYASRYGTMPAGYGLRSLADTNTLDRLNEMLQSQKELKK